jgi:hypothetical protein
VGKKEEKKEKKKKKKKKEKKKCEHRFVKDKFVEVKKKKTIIIMFVKIVR